MTLIRDIYGVKIDLDAFFNENTIIARAERMLATPLLKGDIDITLRVKPAGANVAQGVLYGMFSKANINSLRFTISEALSYSTPVNPYGLCENCKKLKNVYLNFSRCHITALNQLFHGCVSLETLYVKVDACAKNAVDTDASVSINGILGSVAMPNLKSIVFEDTRLAGTFSTTINYSTSICPALTSLKFINCEYVPTALEYFLCNLTTDTIIVEGLDASKVSSIYNAFSGCTNLVNLEIPTNIGKAFTAKYNSYNYYTMYLSKSTLLSHDSLMNVIDNIYDLNISYNVYDEEGNPGTGTLYTQKLVLGETNLAKLTPEEIAIATNKGWTVS